MKPSAVSGNTKNDSVDINKRIKQLESENRILKNKVKVLRIQLDAQSHLHSTVCFCPRRNTLSRSQLGLKSSSMTNVEFENSSIKRIFNTNISSNERINSSSHYESVPHSLHTLRQQLQDSQSRILELERELAQKSTENVSPTKIKTVLNENVELIRLKRLCKKQSAQISSLEMQLEEREKAINNIRSSINYFNEQRENLLLELSKEKDNSTNLYSELMSAKANIKIIEEQLIDIQKEKAALKEHNDNLLKLSLQTEIKEPVDDKNKLFRQINELEDSLRKEIIAKSGLSSKLADAELLISKLKTDAAVQAETMLEQQKRTLKLQEEYTCLQETYRKSSSMKEKQKQNEMLLIENKSTMTDLTESNASNLLLDPSEKLVVNQNSENGNMQEIHVKLSDALKDLSQCKEFLQVQYTLNNKYKQEIEQVQRMFNEIKETVQSCVQMLVAALNEHNKRIKSFLLSSSNSDHRTQALTDIIRLLDKIRNTDIAENIKILVRVLEVYETLTEKCDDELVDSYRRNEVEKVDSGTNTATVKVTDAAISTTTNAEQNMNSDNEEIITFPNDQKPVRRGSYVIENQQNKPEMSTADDSEQQDTGSEDTDIEFELFIEKIVFQKFPAHLRQKVSDAQRPLVFLTWVFFNDNENRAYTPTKPIDNAVFDCTCHYKGTISNKLIQYLKEGGIHVEIYLLQEDISVRIAKTTIETRAALSNCNEKCQYIAILDGQNVAGSIICWFKLDCNVDYLTRFMNNI